jgi:T5SS/PEP-CTERM-associated repeat protein
MKPASLMLGLSLIAAPGLRAQLVNDGATNTLSNVTNIITGSVTVGTNGSFTLLVLSNNCLLTNSVTGFIGRDDTARSNEVRLVGTTARWRMGRDLFVGTLGSFNRLSVSNGAVVQNRFGYIGTETGSNNSALVTGAGSIWHNHADLHVGRASMSSRLEITSGGRVVNSNGVVGTESSGNFALVSGSGSVWSNRSDLTVGNLGTGNQLQVRGGGLVVAANGSLGQNATASANTGEIRDAGSEWRFSGNFNVGSGGSFNQLLVSGGARVNDYSGIIGGTATGSNNTAIVSGAGSLWNNSSGLTVGLFGERSALVVSNGGTVVASSSDVGTSAAHNRSVVTGSGSVWSNHFNLNVGYFGHSNRVRIENGALLVSGSGSIGNTGQSNEVSVTGAGSLWDNPGDLTVGFSGRLNQLLVSDGATALTGGDARIGDTAVGVSNAVVTGGPGARWLVASNLYVGNSGSFNRLLVSNGGVVGDINGDVGFDFDATNNLALVTGAGSVWSNDFRAASGYFGNGNQLIVSNGAALWCNLGFVGFNSSENLGVVTGTGSKWIARDNLYAGGYGNGNRLVVANGGVVISDSGTIGIAGASNTVTVSGAGSLWSNRVELTVGTDGGANRLNVQSGGTVFAGNVFVGRGGSSTNNRVVVQTGGTLRVTTAAGTGVLDVRRGTNVLDAGLVDVDRLVLTNRGTIPAPIRIGDGGSISIPDSGPATPYPSTITVAELIGVITGATVTLSNLSHTFPTDLDILLVSPAGQKVMLMSDAGGGGAIVGARLTFDDSAGTLLPEPAQILTGTYRPTNYAPGDAMPGPAPGPPYSTNLSSFHGSNANGVWSLYINDDTAGDGGSLVGWSVQLATDGGPFLDPSTFEFNGGTLITRGAVIDNNLPFVVGGPGGVPAVWEVRAGVSGHSVASDVVVGSAAFTNSLLHVTGGTMNAPTLDIRGGTNRLDAGLIDVNRLVVTNARGHFEFNGGTLRTRDTTVTNGRDFTVGNGTSTATLQLLGGTHTFANNLTVAAKGSLIGTGIVDGTVTVSPGGRLTPGAPIGSIDVRGRVILQGAVNLQIDKSSGVRTSDRVTSSGAIFYGSTLNVTDIGTDVLAAGDRFFLFDATPYAGVFTTLNLPPLAPGLTWRNNLSVDGSIEVVTSRQPGFSGITVSGTNVVITGTNGAAGQNYAVLTATNVTTPATKWLSLMTNQFGADGQFSFTNGINRNEPQRYFRLHTP